MKNFTGKTISLLLLLFFYIYSNTITGNQTYAQGLAGKLEAKIESKSVVEVGKNIILDGTQSVTPQNKKPGYDWTFGDGEKSTEDEVVHVFTKPGRYTISLEVSLDGVKNSTTKEIFVYTKIITVINDKELRNIRIQGLKNLAADNGVFLKDLSLFSNFTKRKELLDRINEEKELVMGSETIMFWVDDIRLLGLLADIQGEQKTLLNLEGKTLIIISQLSLNNIINVLKNNLSDNLPEQIILTRPEAVDEVIQVETQFLPGILRERGYDVEVVMGRRLLNSSPFNIVSKTINDARKSGFPDDFVLLFLLIPVIILILNIGKNLFGVTTINIGVPILLVITLYTIGLFYGVLLFTILYFINYLLKNILNKYHLLPISKSALIISITTTVLFITLLILASKQVIDFQRVSIYPFIVLTFFIDRVINVEKRSVVNSIVICAEMLAISVVTYWIISITSLQLFILSYPEIALLLILLNIPIGRYTGLTVKEYVRFKDIIFKEE